MIHLYVIKCQARKKRYLKNEIIQKKQKQKQKNRSVECCKVFSYFQYLYAGVTIGGVFVQVADWRAFGRFQEGIPQVFFLSLCVWRFDLEFRRCSLMILLWAFKWSFSAVECSHSNPRTCQYYLMWQKM